jgi:hypothetical protein
MVARVVDLSDVMVPRKMNRELEAKLGECRFEI